MYSSKADDWKCKAHHFLCAWGLFLYVCVLSCTAPTSLLVHFWLFSSEIINICSSNHLNIWCLVSVNLLSTVDTPTASTSTTPRRVWLLFWLPSGWIYLMQSDHLVLCALAVQWMPLWTVSCCLQTVSTVVRDYGYYAHQRTASTVSSSSSLLPHSLHITLH